MEDEYLNKIEEYKTAVYDVSELPDEFKYPDFEKRDLLTQEITFNTTSDTDDRRGFFLCINLGKTTPEEKFKIRWMIRLLQVTNFILTHTILFYGIKDDFHRWLHRTILGMIIGPLSMIAHIALEKIPNKGFKRSKILCNEIPDPRYKTCSKCKHKSNWKPERAHHCKVAQTCIPKMDHYCPLTLTTVGYSNHKAFILFCTYQSLAIFYWMLIAAKWIYSDYLPFCRNHGFLITVAFTGFLFVDICILFALLSFTFTMSVAHFEFIFCNITTLDNLSFLDPVRSKDIPVSQESRFIWDLGWMNNLKAVGFLEWFWWIPKKFGEKYEGYYWNRFDKSKECIISKGAKRGSKEEFLKEAERKYWGHTLIFAGSGYKVSECYRKFD